MLSLAQYAIRKTSQIIMLKLILMWNSTTKKKIFIPLLSLYICVRIWEWMQLSECELMYQDPTYRELCNKRDQVEFNLSQPLLSIISQKYPETKGSSEEPRFLMPCYSIVHRAVTRIQEVEMGRKLTEELYKYARLAKTEESRIQIAKRIESNRADILTKSPTIMEYACWLFEKCQMEDEIHSGRATSERLCHCLPRELVGALVINTTRLLSTTTDEIIEGNPEVEMGGYWKPSSCRPRRRVAVIVPFRDRYEHLRAFLAHMHPILQRQQVEYRVFVVEQRMPYMFNKAAVMNAAFREVRKLYKADCVLFHDVDTLPERDDNMLVCGDEPIHWGGYNPRFNYTFQIHLFGSATLMRPALFERVNGYTNMFYGWGGEDDNLMMRFQQNGIGVYRGPISIMRCLLIDHIRDQLFSLSQNQSDEKITLWNEMLNDPIWKQIDGLKTTHYEVVQRELYPTHTWILLNILRPVLEHVINFNNSANYLQWLDRCIRVGYPQSAMKFSISSVSCSEPAHDQNMTRYFKSRVTCQHMCEVDRNCTFFEYHSRPIDEYDPYCVLYTEMDCDTKTSESVEIYRKILP